MKNAFFLLLLVSFIGFANAGNWTPIRSQQPVDAKTELISSDVQNNLIHFQVDGFFLNPVKTPRGEAFTVSVGDASQLLMKDAPDLPKLTASLIIPDMALMEVEVVSSEYVEFNNLLIAPSKGNLSRTTDPASIAYEFGRPYNENQFFPAQLSELRSPFILRDYRGQTVVVNPFVYNPVTKVLRVYTDITVRVYQAGTSPFNAFNRNGFPAKVDPDFAGTYQHQFLNTMSMDYTPLNDYGRMLIISHGPFMSAMQPFVDWKNSMGIQTEMVDVATIGVNATAIKDFVANYYNTNGLTFLLLIGDGPQIPTNTTGSLGGPSDVAYGYIVGNDHYPDVFVGRFSAENAEHVTTMVQRTLEYERDPYTSVDWMSKGIGIASDQGPGDDNEYDYQHIRNIRTKLMAFTYSGVSELYDGSQGGEDQSGNPTAASVSTVVNAGSSIINYTGHGSQTSWGTTGFSNTNVNQLTNNHMWPFILSVACVNGDFVSGTCFAEAWLRAKNTTGPTGAVATVMSTINQSWDPPMAGQDEMDDLLVGTFPDNIKRTFGGLTMNGCYKMNEEYGAGGDEMTDTWTIFGDPSLLVRTDEPTLLVVNHDEQVFLGSSSFTLNCNTDGALVGLSMNNEFMGSGFISNGSLTISFPAMQTPDTMHVVITAFNKLPYETDVAIIPNNGPYLIYNNNIVHDVAFNNNGQADFGETVTLDLALNNIGVLAANDVQVDVTTTDAFITLIDSTEIYTVVPAGDTTAVENAFSFTLLNTIPDLHVIPFHFVASDGTDSWSGNFTVTAHAGVLKFSSFDIDDSNGNNNGKADPGETFDLFVTINNAGTAPVTNVSGQISLNDPWLTLSSAAVQNYGDLGPGMNDERVYTLVADENAPNGHVVPCAYLMTADLGLNTATSFNVIIGQIPVAVIDLDMNGNSGPMMLNALIANNVFAEYKNVMPADISGYQTIFVCLGTSNKKHVLTSTEGQKLADFLTAGGKLYMEGGDTWYYDTKTAVHPMFKANGVMDGGNDLSVETGQAGTFCDSLSFAFAGDNEFIDHIAPIAPAFSIFKNNMPVYISAIAYDAGTYRSIASAFEFGGLTSGDFPSTRNEYMRRIIEFFGVLSTPLAANFMGSPINVCEGGTVTFNNYSTGGANAWQWSFPGGDPETSTDPAPAVTYALPGLYDVTLIVSNGQYSDTLVKPSYVWVEYCTGLNEMKASKPSVYPNPAANEATIHTGNLTGIIRVSISDAKGQVSMLPTIIPAGKEYLLDVSGLSEGIYMVRLSNDTEQHVLKLMIHR
ncbi:MAG: T9SS type A sorting domain-containing protein [Bacteroidales bacterium]|nr:T9SS type A sorting domain-containing protein [Bacteroidales bacterium]